MSFIPNTTTSKAIPLYTFLSVSPFSPFSVMFWRWCRARILSASHCSQQMGSPPFLPLSFVRHATPITQNCTQPPLLPPITHPRTLSPHVVVCARIDRTLLSAGCNTVETLSHLICIEFSFSFYMADHVLTYPQRVSFRNIIATL